MDKIHVGLIYGGRSSEHEVSLASARNVFGALARERYRVTPIRIGRDGRWHVEDGEAAPFDAREATEDGSGRPALCSPLDEGAEILSGDWRDGAARLEPLGLDLAFPMLHGQNGEDGRVQGLLQTLGLPYVGADVLGSAACMDKEVAKRLLRDAGLPVVPFRVIRYGQQLPFEEAAEALGRSLFVKPANSGSSVGASKVADEARYEEAVADAFAYDNKVLVETAISGREIECGVIGNEEPRASVPGEVVSTAEFYTYDAKYEDEDATRLDVPADLPDETRDRVRSLAARAYRILGCEGMARVDFFATPDDDLFVNEINTIPGFTQRSLFPLMWEHTGLPLDQLVDTLIQLAFDRHDRDARLKTTRK